MDGNNQTILLGVNVDHCATLRQARYRTHPKGHGDVVEPDPVQFALACEAAGADGITIHLREDRRHIQWSDLLRAREQITTRLNLEMACTPEMVELALQIQPDSVCLVPESREEITTEGGLDVVGHAERVAEVLSAMQQANIVSSLFIDPDPKQIDLAAELASPWIELHTGAYANAYYGPGRKEAFAALLEASEYAHAKGLVINAGHGINYTNIREIVQLPHLRELNIGHTIVSQALFVGVQAAVRKMKAFMRP